MFKCMKKKLLQTTVEEAWSLVAVVHQMGLLEVKTQVFELCNEFPKNMPIFTEISSNNQR